MKVSENGINIIKKYEGLSLRAYRCPAGVLTIGYGHTGGVMPGQSITATKAEQLLRNDVQKYEKHVSGFKYDWNQNEFDALVSFAYNIGSINQLTNNGKRNKKTIANKMLEYVNAGGRRLDGLVKRRKEEHDLFLRPVTDDRAIAQEVIDGKWGNGAERKERLTNAGYDYKATQKIVNEILKG